MNDDTVKGTIKELGGKARGLIDHATGDKEGEAHAKKDELEGNLQKNYGKAKDSIKKVFND